MVVPLLVATVVPHPTRCSTAVTQTLRRALDDLPQQLRRHREEQREERERLGLAGEAKLVFDILGGTPIEPRTVAWPFDPRTDQAGVRPYRQPKS